MYSMDELIVIYMLKKSRKPGIFFQFSKSNNNNIVLKFSAWFLGSSRKIFHKNVLFQNGIKNIWEKSLY